MSEQVRELKDELIETLKERNDLSARVVKLLQEREALQRERDQLEDLAYRLVPNSDGPMFKTTWKAEAHKLEQERDLLKRQVEAFVERVDHLRKCITELTTELRIYRQETP